MNNWIKTYSGALCNLSRATDVVITPKSAGDGHIVKAVFGENHDGSQDATVIAMYPTHDDAQEAVNDLYDWLRNGEVGSDFTVESAVV